MRRVTDLTPKFSNLKPAEREFEVPYIAGDRPLGESAGGLALYSNKFKRGYGDKVFGSDENGIWLGAAEFEDAPFSVDMEGNAIANSISLTSDVEVTSALALNQLFTSNTPTEVTGSSFNITLTRTLKVFILATITGWCQQGGAGDWVGRGITIITINDTEYGRCFISGGVSGTDSFGSTSGTRGLDSAATHRFLTLAPGTYTVKLKSWVDNTGGTPNFNIYRYIFSLFTIGS